MGLYDVTGTPLNEPYYICTEYGVTEASRDCTGAFQDLMNLVYENGGGVIFIPNGMYRFDTESSSTQYSSNVDGLIQLRPNVSIIGETMNGVLLKIVGQTSRGSALFVGSYSIFNEYVYGATYSNFTVDGQYSTVTTPTHRSKAFYTSGMYDCVFRDLRLLNTISTALGIDMLKNVTIDSVYCENCGRGWTTGVEGCAGIGIGTGKWTDENFIIRNCVCVNCGHFGIFLEDQGIFANPKVKNYSKGQIIANNVCRNGRNYGIGLRGGRYVNIIGNNVYSNANGGIYLDYGADGANISGNIISDETNAICFGTDSDLYACTRIAVHDNTFVGCTNGVVESLQPTDSVIQNNITMA